MPRDDLQELINTLSSAEKRYYTNAKGGEGYNAVIFETIKGMEEYDRETLIKKLKNPKLVKNLAKYKSDTYNDILRELRAYREDKYKSVDIRLKVWLTNADLLIERGLYKRADDFIKKAKELATKYDKFLILMEVIAKEEELARKLNHKDLLKKREELSREKNRALKIINDEQRYNDISYALYAVFQSRRGGNGENLKNKLDAIIDDEIMQDKTRAVSFASQYRYPQIQATYHLLLGEKEQAHQHYVQVIECWNKHIHQRDEYTEIYVGHYFNYLNSFIRTGRHEEYEAAMQWGKEEIKSKNIHEQLMVFQRLSYSELFYHMNKGNVERFVELMDEADQKLKKYEGQLIIPTHQAFQNTKAQILFFRQKYREARKVLQHITGNKDISRIEIKCCAWILLLAIACETEDDNFANIHRSASRYFRKLDKEGALNDFYKLCLKKIQQLDKAPIGDRKTIRQEFKDALLALPQKATVGLDEMLIWLEALVSCRSMLEVLKEWER